MSQVSLTNGPWEQVTQLLWHCEEVFMNPQLLQNKLACLLIELHVLATCLWMKKSSRCLLRQQTHFLPAKDQLDLTIKKLLVLLDLAHCMLKHISNTGRGKKNTLIHLQKGNLLRI